MSVVGNDIRGREVSKVNIGLKHQRVCILLLHAPFQFAVQREMEWLAAVRALAIDLNR